MKCDNYLALAFFTFGIGVAISPIRFYSESTSCGWGNESLNYRSSYFIRTSDSYISYDSEAEASKAFTERLSGAIEVYDVSPKVSKSGVLIEQRAVALFYDRRNDKYHVVSLSRDGRILRSISSRSYTHVKEFEKQNF